MALPRLALLRFRTVGFVNILIRQAGRQVEKNDTRRSQRAGKGSRQAFKIESVTINIGHRGAPEDGNVRWMHFRVGWHILPEVEEVVAHNMCLFLYGAL